MVVEVAVCSLLARDIDKLALAKALEGACGPPRDPSDFDWLLKSELRHLMTLLKEDCADCLRHVSSSAQDHNVHLFGELGMIRSALIHD